MFIIQPLSASHGPLFQQAGNIAINNCASHSTRDLPPNLFFSVDAEQLADLMILASHERRINVPPIGGVSRA